MIILKDKAGINIDYNTELICNNEQLLYFDIETTGFSSKSNYIYLIGCLYYKEGQLYITQYLAENSMEESLILQEFYKKASKYDTLIHYNGQSFDIPFINERSKLYNINFNFDTYKSIDIYRLLKPYSAILKTENLKQKTVEKLIGIDRKDPFNGGELIEVYNEYTKTKDQRLFKALMLHNLEDIIYLAKLTCTLAFIDTMNGKYSVKEYNILEYKDVNANMKKELTIKITPSSRLPFTLSYNNNGIFINGSGKELTITVTLYEGELKFFFKNYKDYYYLPLEDKAVHKSIASFVDKKHRTNATKENCYVKKSSLFLPIFNTITDDFGEIFKNKPEDTDMWIDVNVLSSYNIKLYSKILIKNIKGYR